MMTTTYGAFLVSLHYLNLMTVKKKMPKSLEIYYGLWNHSTNMSFVVSIGYWATNYDCEVIDLNNILVHITNSAVLIIDVLVVKHPSNFFNFFNMLLFEIKYTAFTIIYQYFGGLDK